MKWMDGFLSETQKHKTDKTDRSPEANLQGRLDRHGISICIDGPTGQALIVFQADVEAVGKVATFTTLVQLTDDQRREVEGQVDYYESILERRRSHEQSGEGGKNE